jgi:hypothetical protein
MSKANNNNNINNNKAVNNSYYTFEEGGRYLFGDYTPFDENKNFINVLNDFVSISTDIIKVHKNIERLRFVLKDIELFQNEMITKIKRFKSSTEASMDAFHKKYHEGIVNPIFSTQTGTDLSFKTKNALIRPLTDGEREYARQSEEYERFIQSKILDSYNNLITLLQTWLSRDHYNLPYTLTSNTSNIVDVSIDKDDKDAYKISRTNTITLQMDQETSFANTPIALVSSLSYSFSIDRSSLAFWNDKRKVSDLGIEDMPIPVRFKIPISKKLKRSFRFVSGGSDNNQGTAEKEPDFVAADSYYIAYAKLENGKDLSVTLADDTSKLDDRVIKLYYGLSNLYNNNNNNNNDYRKTTNVEFYKRIISEGKLPKIDYIEEGEKRSLNLLQKEFLRFTDFPKILLLGKALVDKLNTLSNPTVVASHNKLEGIKVGDKDAVIVNSVAISPSSLIYNEELVILFLESIAAGFAPLIRKLKEKSPVKGELILRHEIGSRQREEYVVKTEELNSNLISTDEGKKISTILGLSNDVSSNKTTTTFTNDSR